MAFNRLTSFLSPGRKPSSDAIQAAKPNYATVLARTKLGRWSEAQEVSQKQNGLGLHVQNVLLKPIAPRRKATTLCTVF